MKLMITGSRTITDFDLGKYIPEETELIITGGKTGIDALAEKYADAHGISKLILRPNHNKYGKIADIMLNYNMAKLASSVLIIWDEKCEETKRAINIADKGFKPITVITAK